MHIGFDAKRAFLNETGLGNYSRDTIKKFNMKDFISGDLQNKDGVGFI